MMPGDLAPAMAIVTNLLGSLGNSGLGWGPAHHKVTIEERMAKSRSLATARDRTNANIGPNFGNKTGPKTGPNPGPKRRPIWIQFFRLHHIAIYDTFELTKIGSGAKFEIVSKLHR